MTPSNSPVKFERKKVDMEKKRKSALEDREYTIYRGAWTLTTDEKAKLDTYFYGRLTIEELEHLLEEPEGDYRDFITFKNVKYEACYSMCSKEWLLDDDKDPEMRLLASFRFKAGALNVVIIRPAPSFLTEEEYKQIWSVTDHNRS